MSKLERIEEIYSLDSKDYFSFSNEYYKDKRNLNMFGTYRDRKVDMLVRMYNIPEEKAIEITRKIMKKHIKVPTMLYYERDRETRDKEIVSSDLLSYIHNTYKDDDIILPSFTKYDKYALSLDSKWTDAKVADRNYFKGLKKKAEQSGDEAGKIRNDNFQKTKKTGANSLSGHSALQNSPLHTFSYHYALTATTRVTATIGNLYTERMIGGNRNWLSENDAIEDILMYEKYYNRKDVKEAVKKFNLTIPTDEMIREFVFDKLIAWEHEDGLNVGLTKLQGFIRKMDDYQRCYLFYAMDFKTIFKYNPKFTKVFLANFTNRPVATGQSSNMDTILNCSYNMKNMLYTINNDLMVESSLDFNDYKNSKLGDILIGTYRNIQIMLDEYNPFIKSFFKNVEVLPRRLGKAKYMIKEATILSDTDSVCPTLYNTLKGEVDPMIMNPYNIRIMAPLILFLSEKIKHGINVFTTLTNAKEEKYSKIDMKAEYLWSVFIPVNVAKHYTTSTIMQEFFTKKKGDIGSSGVQLIGGYMPKALKQLYLDFKTETIRELEFYGKINYPSIIRRASRLEARIIRMFKENPKDIMPLEKIKPKEEYRSFAKMGLKGTPYFHHYMYEKHFKHLFKNKSIGEPTYLAVKIYFNSGGGRLDLTNDGLELINENKESELAFIHPKDSFKAEGKKMPTSVRIPLDIVTDVGLPPSWVENIDIKETINKSLMPFYVFLGSLGLSKPEDKYFMEAYPS